MNIIPLLPRLTGNEVKVLLVLLDDQHHDIAESAGVSQRTLCRVMERFFRDDLGWTFLDGAGNYRFNRKRFDANMAQAQPSDTNANMALADQFAMFLKM